MLMFHFAPDLNKIDEIFDDRLGYSVGIMRTNSLMVFQSNMLERL